MGDMFSPCLIHKSRVPVVTELSSIVEVVAGIRRTIRYLPAIRQLPGSRNTP